MCSQSLKTWLIVSSLTLLTACGGLGKVERPAVVVNEITALERIECGSRPKASKVHLRKVEPWVITDQAGVTWVGITPQHYENLSDNWAQALTNLKQRKAQVEWYEDCMAAFNERADNFGGTPDAEPDESRGGVEHDASPESEPVGEGEVVDEG